MNVRFEEVVVTQEIPARAAETKQRMVLHVDHQEMQDYKDSVASQSFLRTCAYLVPTLLFVSIVYSLYSSGALSALTEIWNNWEYLLCMGDSLDPPECDDGPDYELGLFFLVALSTVGFLAILVSFVRKFSRAARLAGILQTTLLRQMGWDGTSEYRFEIKTDHP